MTTTEVQAKLAAQEGGINLGETLQSIRTDLRTALARLDQLLPEPVQAKE